jgi:protein-disulfide isomerase
MRIRRVTRPEPMSARADRKSVARAARLAAEAQVRTAAARRRRLRAIAAVLAVAAAGVAGLIALSSGRTANASSGGQLTGAAFSSRLFAGIPQHGTVLGRVNAPVKVVEFADLQCPYCDAYSVQTLPTLIRDYVRTGQVQMRFENLSFIGPDSVTAGRAAAAASAQNKLWNFVDLLYLNQGQENSGYVTSNYLQRLFNAIPGLNANAARRATGSSAAAIALEQANQAAAHAGIDATPSFLIGRRGQPLHQFAPASLDAAPFRQAIDHVLAGSA